MKIGSKLIHNNGAVDKITGALSIPIYQASTFHQDDIDNPGEFDYSRSGNPTRKALEDTIAFIEGGKQGFAFSSGMAATSSVLSIFKTGDHLLVSKDVYGGTHRIVTKFFNNFGLEVTFVDTSDLANIEPAIKKNTKAIFLETPSNPLLKITDLKGAIKIAGKHKLISIVDNTFMSPYLQRPLELGADIVVHSATKFIGGHSDVIAGLVVVNSHELAKRIYFMQNSFGAIAGPQDCWLLLRGLKTLKVRMDFQQKNALQLARYLADHSKVKKVFYPGLDSHQGKSIHLSQADGGGAVLSFKLEDGSLAKRFMDNVKMAVVAVSLGGVETIVSYPVKMSHANVPKRERKAQEITANLIRVSVGLEEIEDLLSDFAKALK